MNCSSPTRHKDFPMKNHCTLDSLRFVSDKAKSTLLGPRASGRSLKSPKIHKPISRFTFFPRLGATDALLRSVLWPSLPVGSCTVAYFLEHCVPAQAATCPS